MGERYRVWWCNDIVNIAISWMASTIGIHAKKSIAFVWTSVEWSIRFTQRNYEQIFAKIHWSLHPSSNKPQQMLERSAKLRKYLRTLSSFPARDSKTLAGPEDLSLFSVIEINGFRRFAFSSHRHILPTIYNLSQSQHQLCIVPRTDNNQSKTSQWALSDLLFSVCDKYIRVYIRH